MKVTTPFHASHLETKNGSLANISYSEIETDTDFDVPTDPCHLEDLTLRWRFQIFKDDRRLYVLEHYTTFEINDIQSADLPDEEVLFFMLKDAYDLFKATVQERCIVLPESVQVESFGTIDVFEHLQQMKMRLVVINEQVNSFLQ